jgi:putative membrane protein
MARLTHDEYQRIRAACDAADRRTHAHFAAVVTPMSDRYELFPVVWSALIALLAGGVMAVGWPGLGLRMAFAIQAAVFVVLSLVLDWQPLRMWLVPQRVKNMRASRMARREFGARVLSRKEHRSGVFLFVSLGERYVEVIASPDVHDQVDPATWDPIIAAFIAAVRAGRTADGVVAAIEACGALLAVSHPSVSQSDYTNKS